METNKSRRRFLYLLPIAVGGTAWGLWSLFKKEPMKEEPMKEEPMKEEPMKEEPMKELEKKLVNIFLNIPADEMAKYDEYFTMPMKEEVYRLSRVYDLDPHLIIVIMKQESRFDPNAKSHAGAYGYLQLTKTAHRDMYRFVYDPDYKKFRKDDPRNLAILNELIFLFTDRKALALFDKKNELIKKSRSINTADVGKILEAIRKALEELDRKITRRIDELFDENTKMRRINNDYLLPVGIAYHARHVSQFTYRNIDKILAAYNQGMGITLQSEEAVTTYAETKRYLKHIKKEHPTFILIHDRLSEFAKAEGIKLKSIDKYYNRFIKRITRLDDPFYVNIRVKNNGFRCKLYRISEGDNPSIIAGKFAFVTSANFSLVNPKANPNKLMPGQFVYIPVEEI